MISYFQIPARVEEKSVCVCMYVCMCAWLINP